MSREPGFLVEGVLETGAANRGEFATIKVALLGRTPMTLVIPAALSRRFLTAVLNALGAARRDLRRRLGSEQAVIALLGIDSITPSACEIAAVRCEGREAVMMRLQTDDVSVVEVLLSPADAERIGRELLRPRKAPEHVRH